jgi:hypothetical protein
MIRLVVTGGSPVMSWLVFDIAGASASPIGASAGVPSTPCSDQTVVSDFPTITPTAAGGLTIAVVGEGQGPGLTTTSPQGALFDFVSYAGERDTDLMDNADLAGHFYNPDTSTEHWSWSITSIGNNSCFATAVNFLGQ